jgi:hypothetical protein
VVFSIIVGLALILIFSALSRLRKFFLSLLNTLLRRS